MTREKQESCLKICLFGLPETLVIRSATAATRKVVSSPTLIGPFKFEHARKFSGRSRSRSNLNGGWNHLASGRCRRPDHKHLRKAEEATFKADFSFFASLSTTKAHVFGVKFIGLYGTVVFIAIRDFYFWGESHLWSDVWPAMDGVVCLPFF